MRTTMRLLAALAMALGLLLPALAARAQDATPTTMPMPMASATPMAMGAGAAYMTIQNTGTEAERLVSAKTDVAQSVEIHEVKQAADGTMQMSPLANGLEIPAGQSVELKPGGYHIMLFGLKQDLTLGASFDLTLTFEKSGDVAITVPVLGHAPGTSEGGPAKSVGQVTVLNQWSRPAPATAQPDTSATAAAYLTIQNTGTEADRLVSAKTDVAAAVEIHEAKMDDSGMMQMNPLPDGLEIPAGKSVALEPGGYHLMLVGIKQDFTLGFSYELTLTFEKAGDVTITVPVLGHAPGTSEGGPAVKVGQITVSNQWSRPAPATGSGMDMGNGNMGDGMGTPEAGS